MKLKLLTAIVVATLLTNTNVAFAYGPGDAYVMPENYKFDGTIHREWVKDLNGKWKYVDEEGNKAFGLFYDENGDIYYSEDGYIYTNKKDKYGQYYGEDGRLVNPGAHLINNDKAEEYTAKLNETGYVKIEGGVDLEGFYEYYYAQGYLYKQPISLVTTNREEVELYDTPTYKIGDWTDEVEGLFDGTLILNGVTPEEKIQSALSCFMRKTIYDLSSATDNMEVAIANQRMCCWHFARLFTYIMNENGIYTEELDGIFNNNNHSWARCKWDGKWHYYDISSYVQTGETKYLDMDYQFHIDNYKVLPRVISKDHR